VSALATYAAALLAWSAVHLLWQGGAVMAIWSYRARTTRPSTRERFSSALAVLVALVALLVLNVIATHLALSINARQGSAGAVVAYSAFPLHLVLRAFDRSFDVLTFVANVWLAGTAAHFALLAIGSWRLGRVLRQTSDPSPALTGRVAQLAVQLGLPQPPAVRLSDSHAAPFVTAMGSGILVLPRDARQSAELDALILHELAHIARRDVETQWVIRVALAVLWFHPVAWRLARMAGEAREECCDARASALLPSPLVLAQALVRLEERRHALISIATATGGALVRRVETLVSMRDGQPPCEPGGKSMFDGTRRLLLGVACIGASGVMIDATFAPRSDRLALASASVCACAAERMVVTGRDPEGEFSLTLVNGRVAEATIAGLPVSRHAIHRDARHVKLETRIARSALTLDVDPRGAIRWNARR
jgi:beta-lactamase regulating signal transducer with metallopeptidase domain